MARPIIEVQGLSKAYRLGAIGATSLKEEVARWWSRRGRSGSARAGGEFWALRDVSFEVQPGEVLGVIGQNGAGKSTLLKILSRITRQTSGEIVLRGRVASLLEVGTGFHPDLSGRNNIYLNGAMLGMKRAEIRRKFDEIVAFAEMGKFIDTPVKRYSSGMYVRLAFAVAAHLEPEILVMDEVLAVGDQAFQRRCLGKLNEVARTENRTVLFVSHNMAAVTRLCSRALYLAGGKVAALGPAAKVVETYLSENSDRRGCWTRPPTAKPGDKVEFLSLRLRNVEGEDSCLIPHDSPVCLEIECQERATVVPWLLHVSVFDSKGNELIYTCHPDQGTARPPRPGRRWKASCTLPATLLLPGVYSISVSACEMAGQDLVALYEKHDQALTFEVSPQGYVGRNHGALIGMRMAWRISGELPVSG